MPGFLSQGPAPAGSRLSCGKISWAYLPEISCMWFAWGRNGTALLRRDEKNVPEGDQEPGEGCIIKHPMMERCSGEAGCGQPRQVFWEEFCPCKEALRTSSRHLWIVAGGPLRRPGSVHPGRRGTRVGECTARRQPLCPFLQGAGLLQLYWQQWLIL